MPRSVAGSGANEDMSRSASLPVLRHRLDNWSAGKAHPDIQPGLKYRPDIDGLRAVAVLAVVAYHAGIATVGGGYVGVDVFFVISGFLIGSIVLDEAREGRFSVRRFYERRIRRILPALVLVLLATFALATVHALPTELAQLGRSMLATLFFASNIYFWRHSDYFDAPAEMQPLLHTWSLAIEEQFYLFIPITLVLLVRHAPRQLNALAIAGTVLYLLLCIWATRHFQTASFYLLPTRAWELFLGILIALGLFPRMDRPLIRNFAAAAGLAMVGAAVFLFTSETNFPGANALLPTVGTALVIGAGLSGTSLVGRLLSLRPIVFVGLISYSLYLWHWPILVFQRSDAFLVENVRPEVGAGAAIALSFVVAILSWRFVERPFRSRANFRAPKIYRVAAAAGTVAAATALVAVGTGGLPHRLPSQARAVASVLAYDPEAQYRTGRCMISSGFDAADLAADCLAKSSTERNYLLVGDSHAAHLWYGLDAELSGVNVMQATSSGCRPFADEPDAFQRCRQVMDRVFKDRRALDGVDKLLIAAQWGEDDVANLSRTLDWARERDVEVVLFGPIVQYRSAVPRILAQQRWHGPTDLLGRQRLSDLAALDRRLAAIATAKGVRYVSLWSLMCRHAGCLAYDRAGTPLQFDDGHLTAKGSVSLARLLVREGLLN